MRKFKIRISCILILILLLGITSCSSNSNKFSYVQSESFYSHFGTLKEYDFKMILNTDSKIEKTKKVSLHYGLDRIYVFNKDKNSDEYDQDVVLKLYRYCNARKNSLDSDDRYKEIYIKECKLGDILNINFTLYNNSYIDELEVNDLTSREGYETSKIDYGIIRYCFSITSKNGVDDKAFILNGEKTTISSYAALYYKIVSDDEFYFLEKSPTDWSNVVY